MRDRVEFGFLVDGDEEMTGDAFDRAISAVPQGEGQIVAQTFLERRAVVAFEAYLMIMDQADAHRWTGSGHFLVVQGIGVIGDLSTVDLLECEGKRLASGDLREFADAL